MNYEIIVNYNSNTRQFTYDQNQVVYANSFMVDYLTVKAVLGDTEKMYVVFENLGTGVKTKNVSLVPFSAGEYKCVIPAEVLKAKNENIVSSRIIANITVYELTDNLVVKARTTNEPLIIEVNHTEVTEEVEPILADDVRIYVIETSLNVLTERLNVISEEVFTQKETKLDKVVAEERFTEIENGLNALSNNLGDKLDTSVANTRFEYNENAIEQVESKVDAILDGASVDLDTFKEVAEYFNQNGEVVAQVTQKVEKAEEDVKKFTEEVEQDVAKLTEEVAKANETSNKALQMAQGGLSYKVNDEEVTFDGEIDLAGGEKIDLVKIDNTVYFSYNPDKVMLPIGMPKGAKLVEDGVNPYQIKNGKLYIEVAKIPTDFTKEYLFINGHDYDSDGHEEESASLVISAGYSGYFGSPYVFDSNSMTGVPIDTSKAVMEIDASALGWTSSDIVTSARNNDAIYYVPNE